MRSPQERLLWLGLGGFATAAFLRRHKDCQTNSEQDALERVFDSAASGFARVSLNGRYVSVNDSLCRITGYSKNELKQKTFYDITHPDDCKEQLEFLAKLAIGEIPSFVSQKRYIRKDGSIRWARINVATSRNSSGEPLYFFGIIEDIHEKKIADEELKKRETRYRLAEMGTNDAIWEWDLREDTVQWNHGLTTMLGYPEDLVNASGQWWKGKIHPEDRERVVLGLAKAFEGTGTNWADEFRFLRYNGSYAYVSDRAFIKRAKNGEPLCVAGAMTDISEVKRYQREIEQANKSLKEANEKALKAAAVKSEFLSNMSHEIRTPLNSIIGIAELLGETDLSDEQRQYVGLLKKGSHTLLSIVNDILDITKLEGNKIAPVSIAFDLRDLIVKVMDLFGSSTKEKKIQMTCHIDKRVPRLAKGDPERLERVLTNLIGNAVKFTSEGVVSVGVHSLSHNAHSNVLFTVRDTGIGIPKEKLDSLFNRFSQADSSITKRFGGAGLGLAISRKLVELMGGRIWVESEAGTGAKFSFTVPFECASEAHVPAQTPETIIARLQQQLVAKGHPIRVLLVDDSSDNREVINAYLKRTPCAVDSAENGQEAIERFKKEDYDLVLMDMQMPVMDGYTATKEIRRWEDERGGEHTPIIALSAYALTEEMEKSLRSGCDAHLCKPVKKSELLHTLEEYIH